MESVQQDLTLAELPYPVCIPRRKLVMATMENNNKSSIGIGIDTLLAVGAIYGYYYVRTI